jgi:hypothetical protein
MYVCMYVPHIELHLLFIHKDLMTVKSQGQSEGASKLLLRATLAFGGTL